MPDDDLIAWFIPSLAAILGAAEAKAKRPLSAEEIVAIRDAATVIMVKRADVPKLEAERGYHDVDPEDAPSDWYRLRVEMSGLGFLPKIVWCLLGDDAFADAATALLTKEGIEHEVVAADARMTRAFRASRSVVDPSFTDEDWDAITAHQKVVYVLSKNFTAGEAVTTSRAMLALATRLLLLGATALKCESSGIAHGRTQWLALAERAAAHTDDPFDAMAALFAAFVQYPIGSEAECQTCGMHLVGLPDLIAAEPPREVVQLFPIFAVYLLAELPETGRHFASDNTFSLGPDHPRYRVTREACTGYDDDSFFWNPFGRWRFTRM